MSVKRPPRPPKPPILREHKRQHVDTEPYYSTEHIYVNDAAIASMSRPRLPPRGQKLLEILNSGQVHPHKVEEESDYEHAHNKPYPESSVLTRQNILQSSDTSNMPPSCDLLMSRETDQGLHSISLSSFQEGGTILSFDMYICSKHVFALNADNFQAVAANPNPSIVMFYDPYDPNSLTTKVQFRQAAETKNPEWHQFGGVNCVQEPQFCDQMGMKTLPTYKIFAAGKEVSTVRDTSIFDTKALLEFLHTLGSINQEKAEKARTFESAKSSKSRCTLAKMFGFKK